MKTNISVVERLVRIIIGLVLVGGALLYPTVPYTWIGWIGAVSLLTGLFGWCAVYSLLGISTLTESSIEK